MYIFKVYNKNCILLNFLNKNFKCCSYLNSDGSITYKCIPRNKGIKICSKCLKNNLPDCCYNIYNPNRTINTYYKPFIFNFTYISTEKFPLDSFKSLIPLDDSDSYLYYVYTLVPSSPKTNDNIQVTIHFKFNDNTTTKDGLIFNTTSLDFWNNSITNLNISQFGNIPLSRQGSQFSNLLNIVFSNNINDQPSINMNTSLDNIFNNCLNFNSYIDNWDTFYVTNTSYMFYNCNNFNQSLENLNMSNVNNTSYMFYNCNNFNQNITNWNTSNITDSSYMFYNCNNFNQNISNWNTSNITDSSYMFYNCSSFNQNLNNWNFSNITNIIYMFSGAINFNNNNSSSFNILFNNNLVSLEGLFNNCSNFNININTNGNYWNTSNIINMSNLFNGASLFNSSISSWNTSNVKNMKNMFFNALTFNQDISYNSINNYWNTINVTDMSYMFYNASSFNKYIGNWNTSNIISINNMFNLASNFNNGDNTNVGTKPLNFILNNNLRELNYMFSGASNFNQSLTQQSNYWNTSNITSMNFMFFNSSLFKNGNISTSFPMNWSLSSNLLRSDGTRTNSSSYVNAPLYFSINSSLTQSISPFNGSNFQGSPNIPNINYTNFGLNWSLVYATDYSQAVPNPIKANWVDITTDLSGNIFAIAEKNSTFNNSGIYISNNLGQSFNIITTYIDNSNNNIPLKTDLRTCASSVLGNIKVVLTNSPLLYWPYSPSNPNFWQTYYYSNDFGATWTEKIITLVAWAGVRPLSVGLNGSGNIILMGYTGFGNACLVYLSTDEGNNFVAKFLSTTFLADICSVSVSYSGRYMVAFAKPNQSLVSFKIFYTSDYGENWTSIDDNIPFDNLGGNKPIKMISINDEGNKIFLSTYNKFYYYYYNGTNWILNTSSTTKGIFNTNSTFTGNYILSCGNTNRINFNTIINNSLNIWSTSNTQFIQAPNGITIDLYGRYSYCIINNTNINNNGQYLTNGIYSSILPLNP